MSTRPSKIESGPGQESVWDSSCTSFCEWKGRAACYTIKVGDGAVPDAFYGGWVTADVVGPFKGGPGSWGW